MMNNSEFSHEFDTLARSYAVSMKFGDADDMLAFDEYEKSVYLTHAQEKIVLSLYSGNSTTGESFEQTEEMRRYLGNLIGEALLTQPSENSYTGMSTASKFFDLPDDLWFITYEHVTISNSGHCNDGGVLDVIPVTQDEYHRIKRNPYRGANSRRALRLDVAEKTVEIVCKYTISTYYLRYVKKLLPIVLEDLPDGLTINEVSKKTPCMLHEALHKRILQIAVESAVNDRKSILGGLSKTDDDSDK